MAKNKKIPGFLVDAGDRFSFLPGNELCDLYKWYKDQLEDKKMGPILRLLADPFTFPDAWQTVAFISSLFVFLPSIVVIMFITNEYSYKTHRQNIIDGWSRRDFMLSKMIDVLIISLLVTLLYVITAFAIGTINSKEINANSLEGLKYIGLFFLQLFSQLSIALLIALLVRKAFIALGIFLFYYFPLEPILVAFAKKKAYDIGEFLPLEISDRLIPFPRWFLKDEAEWKAIVAQSNTHIGYTFLLVGITWGLCFWINNKRDL